MPDLFAVSYVGLWIVVIVQTLILLGVTRSIYELRNELTEEVSLRGRRVPKFSTIDISGQSVSSDSILGTPTALLFVSPDCSTCTVSLEELKPLVKDLRWDLVVVCGGAGDDCRQVALDYGLTVPVIADEDDVLKRLFEISGTPSAVRISAQGVIESHGEPARGELFEELAATAMSIPREEETEADRATVA